MSITNFEEWTPGFNPGLKPVVKWLEDFFAGTYGNTIRKSSNPVTGPKLIKAIDERLGIKLQEASLRTCIRESRFRGQVPIGGGGKGYYLITTEEELHKQIQSLEERAEANNYAARCLRNFDIKKLKGSMFDQLFT